MTIERAFLFAVPVAGVLLAGGYFVGATNFNTPSRDVLAEIPEPDSWQVSGEEITDQFRTSVIAQGSTVQEFKAPEKQTVAVSEPEPPPTPVVQRPAPAPKKVVRQASAPASSAAEKPAAAPRQRAAAAMPPPGTERLSTHPRQHTATIIEPPRVSQLPPPPMAEPEAPPPQPVVRRQERGLLGRSWDTVTRTTGAVTQAAVAAPGQVWRATRKTVDVVVDTTVDTAKVIIPGSRRSSND